MSADALDTHRSNQDEAFAADSKGLDPHRGNPRGGDAKSLDSARAAEVKDLGYGDPEYDAAYGNADDGEFDDGETYRTLSKGAVVSLLLAILAQPLLWWTVGDETIYYVILALPLIGALLGLVSLVKIRRHPHEFSGKLPALLGTIGSTLTVVAGIGIQSYILMTEVPDGYRPISWYDLRPHDANERLPIPLEMLSLHGKKVFIKGYVHPSVSGTGPVKQCMLVGDMKTCCFGGQPKLVDRIDAVFENNLRISYSTQRRKLGGTLILNVDPYNPRTFFKPDDGTEGPYYILQVDYLK